MIIYICSNVVLFDLEPSFEAAEVTAYRRKTAINRLEEFRFA